MAVLATSVSTITIKLLGPMQALVDGKPLPHLRSRKALWLLALLTVRHHRPVDRDWVASTLWPDTDHSQALANLRTVLSELRRAMGSQAFRVQSPDRNTLILDVTDSDIDVVEFDKAVAAGNLASLTHAVSLYSGSFLEGSNEEWAYQERADREQSCLQALHKLGDAALTAGDFQVAADRYRQAIAIDPWWDTARRGLMEALAKGGDTNEALQVYRSFEDLLRSESRAVPDEKTTELYLKLRKEARGRLRGSAVVVDTTPRIATGHVPNPLTELIGREDECREVSALIRRSRLVTLTGLGGIGKTRLAIAVSSNIGGEFQDGVWFIGLESLTQASLVPQQIATLLNIKPEASQTWIQCVTEHLKNKRLILVLDNCEHLLDVCAQTAAHLLQECAGVRILATSREVLGITGEMSWPVPGLEVPDPEHLPSGWATLKRVLLAYEGVQLFIERAKGVQSGFALTESNARVLANVCARLEGIPLAIELAAARVKAMTVEQIAERLRDHLGLLSQGSRTAQSRQQALRSTLDWSHELLNEYEQVLLRRLSVFVGGWTLEAAENVCSGECIEPTDISNLLGSLIDKSLVVFEENGGNSNGRYRLLEVVRQYSGEKLKNSGELATLKTKHRDWFMAFAEESEPQLKGANQQKWLAWLEADINNLRASLDECASHEEATEAGMRIAGALSRFWYMKSHFTEGRKLLQRALDQDQLETPTIARANALHGYGALVYRQGDQVVAKAMHEQSLAIRKQLGDSPGISDSLLNLGNVAYLLGDYNTATTLYEESLSYANELDDKYRVSLVLANLGSVKLSQGQNLEARKWIEESLQISREIEDHFHIAWSLNNLGILAEERGDYAAAKSHFAECLPVFRELNEKRGIAWSIQQMAAVAHEELDYESALALYEESRSTFQELGDRHGTACSLTAVAMVLLDTADLPAARTNLSAGLEIFTDIGDKHGVSHTEYGLAVLARIEGDYESANRYVRQALAAFKELGEVRGITKCLEEHGKSLFVLSDVEVAVRIWGTASEFRSHIAFFLSPNMEAKLEPLLDKAREVLGSNVFDAAWEAGRSETWEQVVAQILA
jgi:predicted ATPase/DNA-binding SARP family transcriptional activator